jgi:hypothetical protein
MRTGAHRSQKRGDRRGPPHRFNRCQGIAADGAVSARLSAAIRRCEVCERCGQAPVSKALRIRDPIEGAFDSPSNLLAVCDACYSAAREGAPVAHDRGPAELEAPSLSPSPWAWPPALATRPNGLVRRLTQSAQSTDLRTYDPLLSQVELHSVVQSSSVAPTALFDCAT